MPTWIARRVTKRLLLAGGIAVATVGIGTAAAAPVLLAAAPAPTPSGSAAPTRAHSAALHGLARAGLIMVTAKDTGTPAAAIRTALAGGKSLDDIAGAKAAQVKTDALAALKTGLDKRVAAGKLTAAKEQKLLTAAPAAIAAEMAAPGKPARSAKGDVRGDIRSTLRTAMQKETGLSAQQIAQGVASGKSLDDLAGAKAAAVKADVLAAAKTQLDAAVTAKKLTAAQEQKLLAAAPAQLDKLMAAHRTPRTPGAGARKGRHGAAGTTTPGTTTAAPTTTAA